MDTNKMRDISREQFEAFWRETHCEGDEELSAKWLKREGDDYLHRDPSQAFKIWKASREAVVVELPASYDPERAKGDPDMLNVNDTIQECREAIEAQGLKVEVKP
ncbi:hypothetical protein [Pseudomonas putida]|uniref:hypothetical protein n=1 Tax=Pseudomonas putida TaxID=303 RepID=UPI0002EB61B1|nr:hypothetical protein [Pseudomonas putida]ANC80975.1 hypothetical protein KKK_08095 [Pseudomonas putida B6-2]